MINGKLSLHSANRRDCLKRNRIDRGSPEFREGIGPLAGPGRAGFGYVRTISWWCGNRYFSIMPWCNNFEINEKAEPQLTLPLFTFAFLSESPPWLLEGTMNLQITAFDVPMYVVDSLIICVNFWIN
jgi:hypothetical protein